MTQDSIERPLPQRWMHVCEALANDPGIAMVIGTSDSGKTTWVKAAAQRLVQVGKLPVAMVDADIGQSTIGPPATVALAFLHERLIPNFRIECLPYHGLFFVGSVSPPGHLLQVLVGTKRLVDTAIRSGVGTVLVDTTGLIDQGPGVPVEASKDRARRPASPCCYSTGTRAGAALGGGGGKASTQDSSP
jgi:polynucleotide 5'-hydroxyl-kinase GRC3/NOL9